MSTPSGESPQSQPPHPQAPLPPQPPAPRSRRLWRVVLVVSLALNVLVAGVVVGGAIRAVGPGGGPVPTGPGDMRGLWRALPDDSRGALREQVRAGQPERGDRRARAEQARRDGIQIIGAIEAEPFDPAALVAVLEAQRQRQDALRRSTTEAFAAQVGRLSAAQRQQMVQDLRRLWRRQLRE